MSENGRKAQKIVGFGRSPQHWWKIMASKDAASLIFREYFSEMFGPARSIDLREPEAGELDDSVVGELWGEDSPLIEDWFAVGEDLDDDGWDSFIDDGWTEGVVLTRSGETINRSAQKGVVAH